MSTAALSLPGEEAAERVLTLLATGEVEGAAKAAGVALPNTEPPEPMAAIGFWHPTTFAGLAAWQDRWPDADGRPFASRLDAVCQYRRQQCIARLLTADPQRVFTDASFIHFPEPTTGYDRVVDQTQTLVTGDGVILVYVMGKTASMAVTGALQELPAHLQPRPVYHVHTLREQACREAIRGRNGPHHHMSYALGRLYRRHFQELSWQIITAVREPVGRCLSSILQDVASGETNHGELLVDGRVSTARVLDIVRREAAARFRAFFASEFGPTTGVDVLAAPFDQEKGYTVFIVPPVRILVLKYERLAEAFAPAIAAFLGISGVRLPQRNVTSKKAPVVAGNYARLQATLRLPRTQLEHIYSSPAIAHFYTPAEIRQFIDRWSDA